MKLFIHKLATLKLKTNILCLTTILSVFFSVKISSQNAREEFYFLEVLRTTHNFKEIQKEVETFYSNHSTGKGSGYKQWKRWESFYKNRLLPDGTVPNIGTLEMKELQKEKRSAKGSNNSSAKEGVTGNWTNVNLYSYTRFGGGYNGGIGRINCIVVDPANENIIYVGTPAGGLWRSTTAGNSWEPLTDNLPSIGISGIAIDYNSPIDNRTIYILTGDGDGGHTSSTGVLRSVDNGISWANTGLVFKVQDSKRGYKLVIDPFDSNILMVAMQGGIYRTENAGKDWDIVLNEFRVYDIEFKPRSRTTYAAANGVFYKSTNSGKTWKRIRSGLSIPSGRTAIAVTSKRSSYVYLLFGSIRGEGEFEGLYRSTDSGNNFSLRSTKPNILGYDRFGGDNRSQSFYDLALTVSPEDAEEVHVGGVNCWKSTNGGSTWENTSYWREDLVSSDQYTHADIHALEYVGKTLYVGSDGGIYKTENKANRWESISNGLNISQPYRLGLDPTNADRFVFGSQDNGSNKYENGTYYHWFGADGFESIIDPSEPERIYGCFQFGGLNRSEDSGITSVRITPKKEDGSDERGNWNTPYALDSQNSNVIYAGYSELYKSTNRGNSWSKLTDENIGFSNCDHLAIAPSDNKYIYLIKGDTVYYSHDSGVTWENTQVNGVGFTYIAIHPSNPKILWVTKGSFSQGNKVYKSSDGGKKFINISGSLPNVPVNCIVYEKGTKEGLYIGTDIGIFHKNSPSAAWESFSENLPNTIVTELEIQYLSNKLYAATFGRGVWSSDLYPSKDKTLNVSCKTSEGSEWINTTIANQRTNFEVTFSAQPSANIVNGVVGLSNVEVASYDAMGMIIRFNNQGTIDVRNGGNYLSTTTVAYVENQKYNFRIAVDFNNKTYSVYCVKNGEKEQLLADNFDFRTQQASLANVNNWSVFSDLGDLEVCDFEVSVANQLPEVVMTRPLNNSIFEAGNNITLSSDASDSDGTIERVTWFRNDIRIRSDSGAPYSKLWENVSAGTYEITARAEDNDGGISWSAPVTVRVNPKVTSVCETSNTSWANKKINTENNSFSVVFNVTPNQEIINGVVGLSNSEASSFSDMSVILRLNKQGEFDARNGSQYEQFQKIAYVNGAQYVVRMEVDITTKRYSVYVKSPVMDTEIQVADNFKFRTEVANVESLNYWSWVSLLGSQEVCLNTNTTNTTAIAAVPLPNFNENLSSFVPKIEGKELTIFPNPAFNEVSFVSQIGKPTIEQIQIIDLRSRIVMNTSNTLKSNQIQIDFSMLPEGIYFAKLKIGERRITKKIVVKK